MNFTTAQAAELAGITPASFRREMHRERARGRDHRAPQEQWPDRRTPLWDYGTLSDWLDARNAKTHKKEAQP